MWSSRLPASFEILAAAEKGVPKRAMNELERWANFYLLMSGSAATLLGLAVRNSWAIAVDAVSTPRRRDLKLRTLRGSLAGQLQGVRSS